MFGRRRHVAPAPVAPTPRLSDDQVFTLVQTRLAALIGPAGGWSLTRRTDADTDAIFQGVLVNTVASDITRGLADARQTLESSAAATSPLSRPAEPGQHVADSEARAGHDAEASAHGSEPAAFGWEPAPITVWADLRKPVTAELRQLRSPALKR